MYSAYSVEYAKLFTSLIASLSGTLKIYCHGIVVFLKDSIIKQIIKYQFMTKKTFKKIAAWTGSITLLLVVILCVHIYIVTRPHPLDPHTRAMARIDFKQDLTGDDSTQITSWLYLQKGIDHVLCNPKNDIVVFTFFPAQTTANKIVADFKSSHNYKAERFVPTEADIASGCPMSSTTTYKFYSFIKHVF
jgi:hypothetical protein